ncbi:MAG TPA: metallophosphoesterase, partial [Armatimonadota bacterium]
MLANKCTLAGLRVRGVHMAIYAISDLHLSFAQPKPMDIFGPAWENYVDRLRENWDSVVQPADVVLLPGDLSWAMTLPEAMPDLNFLEERPGRKVLTRGNHDYWWPRLGTNRIQRLVDKEFTFIQGTSTVIDGVGITGTRGWRVDWEMTGRPGDAVTQSGESPDSEQANRIYNRELAYLEKGLQSIPDSVDVKIAMLHFPPFDEQLQPNEFARLLAKYSVDYLVYGHIHLGIGSWVNGEVEGVMYRIVSADIVDFHPQLILK